MRRDQFRKSSRPSFHGAYGHPQANAARFYRDVCRPRSFLNLLCQAVMFLGAWLFGLVLLMALAFLLGGCQLAVREAIAVERCLLQETAAEMDKAAESLSPTQE